MAKLDDFLTKKKETQPILDLFRATAKTPEEFKRLFDKLPEFKIKPERVRPEDLKIREKHFKFKTGKKDLKILKQKYTFLDPVAPEMSSVSIDELAAVPIEWKMLTLLRPKTKTEEELFSRLVELRKLSMKTAASDRRSYGIDPQIKKIKTKAGVIETKVKCCFECGDEFCTGEWCVQFSYDSFARVAQELTVVSPRKSTVNEASKKGSNGKKKTDTRRSRSTTKSSRSKSRKKSKSPAKKSSPNRKKSVLRKSKSVEEKSGQKAPIVKPKPATAKSQTKKSKKNKK